MAGVPLEVRMKGYEEAYKLTLPRRLPVLVRVDGRAFHSYTRTLARPYDDLLRGTMAHTALRLCRAIAGAKFAYTQSDEISVLLTNDDTLTTEPWVGGELQKLVSLAASMATSHFGSLAAEVELPPGAQFDARAFILPPDEVANYFVWRQQDCERNSIAMAAQTAFSHKQLQGMSKEDQILMLKGAGIDWYAYSAHHRLGVAVRKFQDPLPDLEPDETYCPAFSWGIDQEVPRFTADRAYIEATFEP